MAETLIGAIGELMRLQRWNAMPRVEVWSEAENIAYTTHIVYAIGKLKGMNKEKLLHGIQRALLKSLNKHLLSDILVGTRDVIRDIDKDSWKKLVDDAAEKTAKIFPRTICDSVYKYMTYDGDYSIKDDNDGSKKKDVETLIKYAQFKVAMNECDTNSRVNIESYKKVKKSLKDKLRELQNFDKLEKNYMMLGDHPLRIENLKNLRRWNRVNRSVETTVLGHTFMVALLTLVVAMICEKDKEIVDTYPDGDFVFAAILRALFHDVPETFTGDIISPVKDILEKHKRNLLEEVEKAMMKDFKGDMPKKIYRDIDQYNLLGKLKDSKPYKIDSLVKTCDSLAIVLECLLERETGHVGGEMTSAYINYISRLQNSEWEPIRYLSTQMLLEYPKSSWK